MDYAWNNNCFREAINLVFQIDGAYIRNRDLQHCQWKVVWEGGPKGGTRIEIQQEKIILKE